MTIRFYRVRDPNGELSNHSAHGFELDGLFWPTIEHYYQAQKFAGTPYTKTIRQASRPMDTKRMGQTTDYPLCPDWDEVKETILYRATLTKYETHVDVRAALLVTGDEGLEKLRLGVLPLLKVSSHRNHVPNILPTLKQAHFLDVALCTDDIETADLLENGHMDRVIPQMPAHDIEPAVAIRWATLNGAHNHGLRDHEAIAPGYLADILLLDSLEEVHVCDVFWDGQQVVADGKLIAEIQPPVTHLDSTNTIRVSPTLGLDDFRLTHSRAG